VAFLRLVAAATLAILMVLSAAGFALNHFLDKDFRRLGYTDLAAETAENERTILVDMRVWVMGRGIPFRDIRVAVASETAEGATQQAEFKNWTVPDQVGSWQILTFPLPANVQRLATCLIMPSRGLGGNYRVTQLYTVVHDGEGVKVAEISEKRVSKENGSACGSNTR
jgi:hypothetical protein